MQNQVKPVTFKSVDEILTMEPAKAFIYMYETYASSPEFRRHHKNHPRSKELETLLKEARSLPAVVKFKAKRDKAMAKTNSNLKKKKAKIEAQMARRRRWMRFKYRLYVYRKKTQIYFLYYKHRILSFFKKGTSDEQ